MPRSEPLRRSENIITADCGDSWQSYRMVNGNTEAMGVGARCICPVCGKWIKILEVQDNDKNDGRLF